MSSKWGVDNINGNYFEKEYSILCIYNGGKPFYLGSYSSIHEAKVKLYDIISLEQERGRPYYVNNDFFKNEYTQNVKCKYFCIKERNVSNWVEYKEINNQIKNNIIFFNEFCN